jgi:hypothetical protein
VKTSLDSSNKHERIALSERVNRTASPGSRFLLMAIITPSLADAQIAGSTGFFSPRFSSEHVFNLYFAWGYDSARADHADHWEDFKSAIGRWARL